VALELYDLVALLIVSGAIFGMLLFAILRFSTDKKAKKSGSDGVKDMYSVYSDQVKDILKLKDNHIKRLNAELQNYSQDSEENEPQETKYEDLSEIATKIGLDPIVLNNPIVKKYIKKYTKDMSIEEILALVNQFKGFIGNKKPQSNDPEQTENQTGYF